MKNIIKNIYLFSILGVIFMLNSYGCADHFKYAKFSGKEPELNITIDYISSWLHREHKQIDNRYASVVFFENIQNNNYKAKMAVTISDNLKSEASLSNLEEMVNDLVAKRLKFKDAKLLSTAKAVIFGSDAREAVFTYKAMSKFYSKDAKLMPVKERIFIFKRGDKHYLLRYENSLEEFDKYNPAFTHIVKTISIND